MSVAAFLSETVLLVVGLVTTSAMLWLGVVVSVTGLLVGVGGVFIRRAQHPSP